MSTARNDGRNVTGENLMKADKWDELQRKRETGRVSARVGND